MLVRKKFDIVFEFIKCININNCICDFDFIMF